MKHLNNLIDELEKHILFFKKINAAVSIVSAEKLNTNNNFKHHYFGYLNLKPTKKTLSIHANHHLKINKDIIK